MFSDPSYRSAHVQLTQDIDLSELSDAADGWTPIGETQYYAFTGVFDGRDFTIRGLVINIESSSYSDVYVGLFGYVGSGGVVKDVKIVDADINVDAPDKYIYAGIIAGRCAGDISGCSSGGTVTVTTTWDYRVGGIAGYIQNYGDVRDCENTASITVTESGDGDYSGYVGGIAGYAVNVNNIVNCKNGGTVTGGAESYAGGIAGYFDYNYNYYENENAYKAVTLNGCENSGEVTGNRAGGIAGQIYNSVSESKLVLLTNCTNSGEVNGIGDGSMVGGFVGYVDYDSVVDIVNSSTQGTVEGNTCGGIAGHLDSGAKITADHATTWDDVSNPTLTEIGSDPNYTTGATAQGGGLILEYKITATAYEGGTITPNGEAGVTEGGNQTFTITANEGYLIDYLLIDGAVDSGLSGQNAGAYTFSDVRGAHTIEAYFRLDGSTPPDTDPEPTPTTYTITTTASEGGTISPSGELSVTEGEKQTFTVKANEGYVIEAVTADGQAMADAAGKTEYTFEITVTKSQTVSATFKADESTTPPDTDPEPTPVQHTITVPAAENGTITPSGEFSVTDGEKQKFTVKANEGYVIEAVTADGQAMAEAAGKTEYTFEISVTKSQTVSATFKLSGGTTPDDGGTTPDSGGGGGGCSAGFGALALLALVPLALKRRK